jgi:hypothetical protein
MRRAILIVEGRPTQVKSGSYSAACGNAAVTVTALVHPDLRFNEAVFLLNDG